MRVFVINGGEWVLLLRIQTQQNEILVDRENSPARFTCPFARYASGSSACIPFWFLTAITTIGETGSTFVFGNSV